MSPFSTMQLLCFRTSQHPCGPGRAQNEELTVPGYNSEWYINPRPEAMGYPQRFKESTLTQYRGVPVLETVLSKKVQRDQGCAQQIPIMTIWFGEHHKPCKGVAPTDIEQAQMMLSFLVGLNMYLLNATRAICLNSLVWLKTHHRHITLPIPVWSSSPHRPSFQHHGELTASTCGVRMAVKGLNPWKTGIPRSPSNTPTRVSMLPKQRVSRWSMPGQASLRRPVDQMESASRHISSASKLRRSQDRC